MKRSIKGSCHCGAVSFVLGVTPDWVTRCNCSICRKLGAMWAHAPANEIVFPGGQQATSRYIWGDKSIAFHSCKTCGCTTHWENLSSDATARMAVNLALAEPEDIAGIRVRHSGLDPESSTFRHFWIPAFAGMTTTGCIPTGSWPAPLVGPNPRAHLPPVPYCPSDGYFSRLPACREAFS